MNKNNGSSPYENVYFVALFKTLIFWSKNHSFLSKISKNHLFWLDNSKNKKWKDSQFLDKNHGLSPQENVYILARFKTLLFWSKIIFLSRISKNNLFWLDFSKKHKRRKISILGQKPGIIPLVKCPFFRVFKTLVFSSKLILFYPEYQETIFMNIITSKTLKRKSLKFGQ